MQTGTVRTIKPLARTRWTIHFLIDARGVQQHPASARRATSSAWSSLLREPSGASPRTVMSCLCSLPSSTTLDFDIFTAPASQSFYLSFADLVFQSSVFCPEIAFPSSVLGCPVRRQPRRRQSACNGQISGIRETRIKTRKRFSKQRNRPGLAPWSQDPRPRNCMKDRRSWT